jgi:Leucine-rich repeat (LRR) protein
VIEMLARVRAGNDSERLDLSRLQLTLCPGCVYEIESLVTLDLRFNDIYKLPDDFGFVRTFATLESLLLEHNRLRSIPDSFGDMTSITELRLSHNDLRFVAPELSECTLITELALDNNPALESPPIHVVDKGLGFTMSYLAELNKGRTSKTFNLNGRGYLRVPVDLTRYDHLIRLDLSDNHLTNVPNNICGVLTNLEALYCARNRLTGLPDGIGLLFKLLVLDASDNKIGLVPASFTKLRLLHTCSFSNNKLTWVPNTVGHMASMRELSLQGNELRSPPAEIVAQGTMRILRFLRGLAGSEHSRILNLSALGLAALPLMICRQTNLTELKLFQNKIEEVPAKAGRMVKLTHLVLSANRISELPGILTRWQVMQRLYVDDNLLTSIPSSIGQLTHLSELRVAGNRSVFCFTKNVA